MKLIINGKYQATQNGKAIHGNWTVTEVETGRVVSRVVRTLGDLAILLNPNYEKEQEEKP